MGYLKKNKGGGLSSMVQIYFDWGVYTDIMSCPKYWFGCSKSWISEGSEKLIDPPLNFGEKIFF